MDSPCPACARPPSRRGARRSTSTRVPSFAVVPPSVLLMGASDSTKEAPPPAAMLNVTPSLRIDEAELQEAFVRASGPGGQNVNKVSTAVQLRFDVRRSPSLPEAVRMRLERIAGRRITAEGVIVITAARVRSEARTREDARERLAALIRRRVATPATRRANRPPLASKIARREAKRRRSAVKSMRKPTRAED